MPMKRIALIGTMLMSAFALDATARAQVLKGGIEDLNGVPEATLAAMPNMTPAIAKAFVDKRPFATIVEANAFLLSQKLTQDQLTALYEKAFVPLNLNTATNEKILLVPKIARRMAVAAVRRPANEVCTAVPLRGLASVRSERLVVKEQ